MRGIATMKTLAQGCLLLLVLSLCGATVSAAALSARSPVRLGLWHDPAAAGSGFELFSAGGDQVLVWYTYRPDGSPVWYTAAGRFDADGRWEAPLLQHRWLRGARQASPVGKLVLRRQHFESLALEFEVGARKGSQQLVPFPLSGIVPEVDHSGAFYDPTVSGYGLGLTEQGERLVAGLYFYDPQGEATWRVGDNGGRGGEFTMRGYLGACPGCAPAAPVPLDSGRLSLQLLEESRVVAKYLGPAGGAWALDGELRQLSTPASQRPADRQLANFDDEATLRAYLVDAVLRMPSPMPVIDFSPPPEVDAYSSTNVQEAGVDEADGIESDGRHVYAFRTRPDHSRVLRVGETVDGASLQMHADLPLASLAGNPQQAGLYLQGDKLAVVSGTQPSYYAGSSLWTNYWAWSNGSTRLELLDRRNPRAPVSTGLLEFDAHLVSSRRIGDRLYLVLRKSVLVDGLRFPASDPANAALNRAALDALPTAALLPRVRFDNGEFQPLVAPHQVYLPVSGALPPQAEFLAVVGLDLAAPREFNAIAIAGSVGAVYASPTRMYLATTRSEPQYDPVRGFVGATLPVTDVHELALGARGPEVAATGTVEGYLDRDVDRAAFRFSEKDGRLRVVTVGTHWRELGQNRLTVLERSAIAPGLLRTLSYLPNRDLPQPIGKPWEQLYGTRFVGDKLYAVTFRRVDPLYVVDLADPAHPRIEGEVELPGYSDYLHPVGEGLLLGIGHDAIEIPGFAGPAALLQGIQVSLFDVSEPSRPRVLQQETFGQRGTSSAIATSHHALSILRKQGSMSLGLPLRVHEAQPGDPPSTAPWFVPRWAWSGLQRIEVAGTTPADARLVVGQKLVTHSRAQNNDPGYLDDAYRGARSVQFTHGTVYVENGRFWLGGPDGGVLAGPL
jgi:hypothetical protein